MNLWWFKVISWTNTCLVTSSLSCNVSTFFSLFWILKWHWGTSDTFWLASCKRNISLITKESREPSKAEIWILASYFLFARHMFSSNVWFLFWEYLLLCLWVTLDMSVLEGTSNHNLEIYTLQITKVLECQFVIHMWVVPYWRKRRVYIAL